MKSFRLSRRVLWISLAILLALFLAWAGFIAWRGIHLYQTAQAALDQAQTGKMTLAQAQQTLNSASADLADLSSALGPAFPFLNAAGGLPGVGPTLTQVEPLVKLAAPLSQAGKLLLEVFEPALQADSSASLTITERLAAAVTGNSGKLDQVDRLLQQAALTQARINPQAFPERYRGYAQKAARLLPMLKDFVPALKQLPTLLGVVGRQDYLILAQNRDELRATGGFISGIGTATFDGGKLAGLAIGDSYAVDDFTKAAYPTPPAPLKTYMLADYWVARDGNWSPDFPSAAAQVQALYAMTHSATRGVLAFDQLAVKGMLSVTGPIKIASYPDPISAASVEDFMHQAWAPDPITGVTASWWPNRKNFMGELGKELVARLLSSTDPRQLIQLATQVADLIDQGHLLVSLDLPEIRNLLKDGRLDGAINPGSGDFLYLVDSNVGFNKVDSVLKRQLAYSLDLTDLAQPRGTISVTYQNVGSQQVPCKQEATYGKGTYADMQARCYFDYWRLYRPPGTSLMDASLPQVPKDVLLGGKEGPLQPDQVSGEGGTQVFGNISVVATGAALTNSITTLLPSQVVTPTSQGYNSYTLRIEKQPGLAELPLILSVRLPAGESLKAPPAGWSSDPSGVWTWKGSLTSGQEFTLTFGK